jgi:hypothetical protein
MVAANIIVAALSLVALGIAVVTYRSFTLAVWKRAVRYFIAGLALFTIQEFLLTFDLLTSVWLRSGIEVAFIGLLVAGVRELHRTAETLGV